MKEQTKNNDPEKNIADMKVVDIKAKITELEALLAAALKGKDYKKYAELNEELRNLQRKLGIPLMDRFVDVRAEYSA